MLCAKRKQKKGWLLTKDRQPKNLCGMLGHKVAFEEVGLK